MGVPLVNTFLLVFLGYQILTTSNVSGLPFASISSIPSLNLSEASTNKESSPLNDISTTNDSEKLNRPTTSSGDLKLFISSPNVNIYSLPSQSLPLHSIATNEGISLSPATLNTKCVSSLSASLRLPMSTEVANSNKSSYSVPISTATSLISPTLDQELNFNMTADNSANFRRDSRDTGPILSQVPFLSYRFSDCDSSSTILSSPTCIPLSRPNPDVSCVSFKPVLTQKQPVLPVSNNNCDSQELGSSDALSDGVDTNLPCPSTISNPQISSFKRPTSITNDCPSNKSPSPVFLTLKQLNNNQAVKFINIDDLMTSSRSSCNTPSVNLLNDINVIDTDAIQSKSQCDAVDESINESREIISSCNGICQNNVFNNFNARRNLGQVQLEINDAPISCTQSDCDQGYAQTSSPINTNNVFNNFNARRNLGQVQLEINDAPISCTQSDCDQGYAQTGSPINTNNFFNNFNARRNLGQVQSGINDAPNPCTQTDCDQENAQTVLPINANKGDFQNFRVGCEQLTSNNAHCNENFNLGKPIQLNVKNNVTPLSNTNNLGNITPQISTQNIICNNQGCPQPQLRTIVGSNNMNSLAPNNILANAANNLINQNNCGINLGCPQIIPTNNKVPNNFLINNNPKLVSLPTQNQNCPQVVVNNNKNSLQTKPIDDDNEIQNIIDCNENQNIIDISSTNQGLQSESFVSLNDLRIQPNFGLNNINTNGVPNQNNQGCSELLAIAQKNLMSILNAKAKAEANNQNYNLGCPEVKPTAFINNVQQSNIGICLPNNQFKKEGNLQTSSVNLESNCETSPVCDNSQSFLTLKDVSNVIPTSTIKSLFVQPVTQNNVDSFLTPNDVNALSLCNNIPVPSFSLLNLNPSSSIVSTELQYLNQPTIYYPNLFANTNLQTILTLLQSNINNNLQNSYNCVQNGFVNSLVSSNSIPIESLPQVSFTNKMPSPTISIPISVSLPETIFPTVSNLPLVCTAPTSYTSIQPIVTPSSISPIIQTNNIVGSPGLYSSLNNLASTLTQNIISNIITKALPVAILPPVKTVAPMIGSSSTIDSSMCFDVTEPLAPYFIASPQSSRYSFSDIPVACNEYLPPVGCSQFTPFYNSDLFTSASEPDVFECSPFSLSDTDAFYPEISFTSQESCLPVAPSRVTTSSAMQSSSVSKINNTGRDATDMQRLIASLSQGC